MVVPSLPGQLFGDALSKDHIITNVAIYWLTNTAASAARFYYENKHAERPTGLTTVPIGLASFAFDFRPIRRFAERDHANIVSWSEFDRGSHWAAHDARRSRGVRRSRPAGLQQPHRMGEPLEW